MLRSIDDKHSKLHEQLFLLQTCSTSEEEFEYTLIYCWCLCVWRDENSVTGEWSKVSGWDYSSDWPIPSWPRFAHDSSFWVDIGPFLLSAMISRPNTIWLWGGSSGLIENGFPFETWQFIFFNHLGPGYCILSSRYFTGRECWLMFQNRMHWNVDPLRLRMLKFFLQRFWTNFLLVFHHTPPDD